MESGSFQVKKKILTAVYDNGTNLVWSVSVDAVLPALPRYGETRRMCRLYTIYMGKIAIDR